MVEVRPVEVPRNAFRFCRWGMAGVVWLAVGFQSPGLFAVSFLVLLASAALQVRRAPMIVLYRSTVERIWPSEVVILDARAMRFAHGLGALLNGVCLAVILGGFPTVGWFLAFGFAVIKTIGACGYCSGVRLYGCLTADTCCRVLKRTPV